MNYKVKLRKFSLQDLNRIMRIEKSSFPKDAYSEEKFKYLYKKYPDGFIVAQTLKDVAGYIIAYKFRNTAEFDSLAIDKKYRKLGMGKKLAFFMLRKFTKVGLKKAFLEVRATNKNAISFYEKMGFKIKKTIKDFYGKGEDAYLMERQLITRKAQE